MFLKLMITAEFTEGTVSSRIQNFRGNELIIGREQGQLLIPHSSCSRRHAVITTDTEGNPWISDLGSKNGIRCEGEKVRALKIFPGLRLELGQAVIEILAVIAQKEGSAQETIEENATDESSLWIYL